MPRMIVSIDGVVIKEVQLTKERTTLGRRPYNDIVIDNLAVSGEHAVLHMVEHDVEIEDLGSTNGTYVNAKAVKRQELRNGDTVEVGKYKIRFLQDAEGQNFEKTMIFKPGMVPPAVAAARPAPATPAPAPISAVIRVMSGAAAGRWASHAASWSSSTTRPNWRHCSDTRSATSTPVTRRSARGRRW